MHYLYAQRIDEMLHTGTGIGIYFHGKTRIFPMTWKRILMAFQYEWKNETMSYMHT